MDKTVKRAGWSSRNLSEKSEVIGSLTGLTEETNPIDK